MHLPEGDTVQYEVRGQKLVLEGWKTSGRFDLIPNQC